MLKGRALLKRSARATFVLVIALSVLAGTIVAYALAHKSEGDYFRALPNTAKRYYASQLALFGMPSANVAVPYCSQNAGYANYSAPIYCGLSANLQYPAKSDTSQLKQLFIKLSQLAANQKFTDIKLNTTTEHPTFSATAPDAACKVNVSYGHPVPGISDTVPADEVVHYDYECLHKSNKVYPGYDLSQNHYDS